jgi:phosphatidylserine/phosphatidylglycerophosphate/cardiolipin synthase-like enzyme
VKRHLCLTPLLILPLLLLCAILAEAQQSFFNNVQIQLGFTPGGECADRIVEEIHHAKSDIYVQAYSFTSKPIAQALVDAHKRGVKVWVILDKSQRSERYTSAVFLTNMQIPTYIDARHAIAHNKIIIIDKTTTLTGSFNFTKAAQERNAENLLIVRSREIAKAYLDNWYIHKEHSDVQQPRY